MSWFHYNRLLLLNKKIYFFIGIFSSFLFLKTLSASDLSISVIPEYSTITPNLNFSLAVRIKIPPNVHIYADPPGDTGLPTKIQLTLPPQIHLQKIVWPPPLTFHENKFTTYGYKDTLLVIAKLSSASDLPLRPISIKTNIDWLACETSCIPGSAALTTQLNVHPIPFKNPAFPHVLESPVESFTWTILVLAFLGGLILNLMPCVFPVIGIKILSFVQQSQDDRKKITLHGLFFSLGIITSFMLLVGLLLGIRTLGSQIGWGFQLQSTPFVLFLCFLFWLMALNFMGIWEINNFNLNIPSFQTGYLSSFFSGILVSLVATPCTGPFMGSALGFALTASLPTALLIFFGMALGLSSPYLILSSFPSLIKKLPHPGLWMERIKQICSIPLFLTVFWLLWIVSKQQPKQFFFIIIIVLLLIAFLLWLKNQKKIFLYILPFILIAFPSIGLLNFPKSTQTLHWEPFSEQRLQSLRAENKIVFVNFTAAWCLTCQTNKLTTFSSKKVIDRFQQLNIVPLEADWTNKDPSITSKLNEFGRGGVPVSVFYLPNKQEPIILPELLTPERLLQVIRDFSVE